MMRQPANSEPQPTRDEIARAGSWVYSYILPLYDLIVLRLSNSLIWKCPSPLIVDFYNRHVSDCHLDAGVGTGYFLDRCRFPAAEPTLVLADLNKDCLIATRQRIRRYQPKAVVANLFNHPGLSASFGSIGINYVLHCLPGSFKDKAIVFANLKPLLRPGGVVFGTTILGKAIPHGTAAQRLADVYNARGLFGNAEDTLADLETVLQQQFKSYTLSTVGYVAFFTGRLD